MTRLATLQMLPPHPRSDAQSHVVETSAPPSTQSLEDLHLAQRVQAALRATGYGPLRDIEVTVHARRVTLAGRVVSYHLKQVAQETTLAVPGVLQLRNDLAVGRRS